MSTKTLRKRISLIAVAALGFGVVTGVAANATASYAWNVSTAYAGTSTTAGTQIVGGTATLTFTGTSVDIGTSAGIMANITSTGVGSIATASSASTGNSGTQGTAPGVAPLGNSASATVTYPTTSISAYKTIDTAASKVDTETVTLVVSSSVAGTQTLTAATLDSNGSPSATYTATITWVAASATGVNAANSSIWVQSSTTCDSAATTSKAADVAGYAADVIASSAAGGTPTVCVIARDANNNLVGLSASSTISSSINGGGAYTAVSTGRGKKTLSAVTGATGTANISAVLIDSYSNVVTLSTSVVFYGSLVSLTATPVTYSAYAASDQTDLATHTYAYFAANQASTSKVGVIGLVGKDANGNVIDLGDGTSAAADSVTTSNITIDSDKNTAAVSDRASDSLGASVVALAPETTELSSSSWGTNVAYVQCSTKPEKLTLTFWGKDSSGNWIKSNAVPFYCAGAVSKVDVTADKSTAQVNVTDANGYPVPDLTSVTLAASNGAVVAPSTKSTENGKFHTAAVVLPSVTSAFTVTAIVGSKSGTSASIGTAPASSADAQIADLIAKINALSKLIAKIQKKLGVK